jgi:hypothetical protein
LKRRFDPLWCGEAPERSKALGKLLGIHPAEQR